MDKETLGKAGIEVSNLCFGTGTGGWAGKSDQTALGLDGLADLLAYAYDSGITFWDSADQYGSHPHVARACQIVGRENVTITSKTTSRDYESVKTDIDRFLTELETDCIDIVLMHCLTSDDWPQKCKGAMDALSEAKEAGKIRAHGVSCHDYGAFQEAARSDWVEVVLARVNYGNHNMDGTPEEIIEVLEAMDDNEIGVYGMKVVGAGKLGHDARNAIHYVLDLPAIDSITIGMVSKEQVDENVGWVEKHAGIPA
jgi:aryl-alcohol dehydrogenase-like predicted oxidoreductase